MAGHADLTRARGAASRAGGLFPVRVVRRFVDHGGPSQTTLIAWNALTAIFPITLALAAVGGLVLQKAGVRQERIGIFVASLFPSDIHTQLAVQQGIEALRRQTALFAVLALVGFVWTGSGLFGAMEEAFGAVFQTPSRPFLRQKLMALAMMALFMVVAIVAVGTSALLPLLSAIPGLPPVSLAHPVLGEVVQVGVGVVCGFLLFSAIYYVVPNRRQRPGRVLPAAIFAGVAFELLTLLFPIYISFNRAGINQFGSQFALLFVLLAFFYFLGLITVLGADVIAELDPPRSGQ